MKLINGLYELTPEEIKLLEKQDDTWPKIGDEYWFFDSDGAIGNFIWKNVAYDKTQLSIGNVFSSKEDAEAHVEYLKAVQIIKKDAKGFVPDWSDGRQSKHFGYYYWQSKSIESTDVSDCQYQLIYFATKQDIEDSFKSNKQAWLTYLGVKG